MAAAAVRKSPADAAATGADALGHAASVKRAAGPEPGPAARRVAEPALEAAAMPVGAAKAAGRAMPADADPQSPANRPRAFLPGCGCWLA
jgi:hypothetical protein